MKKRIAIIVCIVLLLCASIATTVSLLHRKKPEPETPQKLELNTVFSGKVNQWQKTLGTVKRNIPSSISNEGLNSRYPTYGTSLSGITDTEKDNLLSENSLMLASGSTYDTIDADGNLYLNGVATGKKLYKHTASVGMYYGDVSDSEPAVVEQITVLPIEQRNYVTGLYAPAGEVVKIEISQDDLNAIGGELIVYIGQVSHRNNLNNIWKDRNDFSRMPVIANRLSVKTTTAYVGNPLGGPIYIYPSSFQNVFSVTISGAVKYAHYVHGQTTREECEKFSTYSAPYFDYEIWDMGVRHSGSNKYANYDYDNLVKVGNLWEKIIRTSRLVPCSANVTIGVGYVYDCFVAAGAACAFQGGHSWINAPCNWMSGSLNYNSMVSDGFWGQIHEYNHLYQSYGMESSKTNEVTNNATSLLSYTLYTKISEKRSLDDSSLGGDWNRYTDPSRSLRETITNANNGVVQNTLNAYADLIHTFGVDVYTKATRLQVGFGVDNWYEALSKATDYNFTYYFEKLLGQTLSDEKKKLFDTTDRITFVPVATVFQTGRDYFQGGVQCFSETVRPYLIERGESQEINFNERLILPSGFSFTIKSISKPNCGTIEKLSENVYKYTPGSEESSGTIKVVVGLNSEDYSTKDVTLTLNFKQYNKNQVVVKKYTYGGDIKYTSVADAVQNNFEGYTALDEYKKTSTFLNNLANTQIGVVEGKVYIPKSGTYAFCLRSGRGNNTLYLAVNDNNLKEVLSLNSDHGGFQLEGEHVVKLTLKKGDYVYFREITLSRHYANDAFTELGWANLDENAPSMVTIPTRYLCDFDMLVSEENFVAPEKYPRVYTATTTLNKTDSGSHTLVSANMPSWDGTTGIENIFDGDPSTFFHNNRNNFVNESNVFVLVADMGFEGTFNSIKIISRTSGQENLPCTFKLYGSLDNSEWFEMGNYNNLGISGNVVSANFNTTKFRYYKLQVSDTKSANGGNKYVTISSIEFSYNFAGVEMSPYVLDYYTTSKTEFNENSTFSTFGKLVSGNGTIKYKFFGTGLAFLVRQNEECKIKVAFDGNIQEITLNSSDSKQVAFAFDELKLENHEVEIEIISGTIYVDSLIERN